ncbi:MAG TPA: hypothetical protein P5291_12650 [Flavobacteriales bacterium]|nr:hypothetical protein [Flavobacteriales bacterium]
MEKTLFYKELGRLLYAIAAADGRVQKKERDTLKWVVKDLLVPVESGLDHHGTDKAYITEFEFDVLADRHATSQEAFDSFVAYMAGHHKDLTEEQRELVLTCAEAVAHAYHGVGAKELPLLIELNKHLRQG